VRGYTLGQLRTFSEAAERARRRDLIDHAWNLRAAQFDKSGFEEHLKRLDG
jgi:hypothetical protein